MLIKPLSCVLSLWFIFFLASYLTFIHLYIICVSQLDLKIYENNTYESMFNLLSSTLDMSTLDI